MSTPYSIPLPRFSDSFPQKNFLPGRHNYVIDIRRAQEEGKDYGVPRVADLIARPDFVPLRAWLTQRQENLDELQQKVDVFIDQCRKAANGQ